MQTLLYGCDQGVTARFDLVFHSKDLLPLSALFAFDLASFVKKPFGLIHALSQARLPLCLEQQAHVEAWRIKSTISIAAHYAVSSPRPGTGTALLKLPRSGRMPRFLLGHWRFLGLYTVKL